MQDIKRDRVERERSIRKHKEYVSKFEPLFYVPCLRIEGFQLSTIGSFTQGPSPRNYNSTPKYTTSLYAITSTQEGAQSKERNTLGDHKDYKHSLGDLKGSQTIFSHNTKILKIDLR